MGLSGARSTSRFSFLEAHATEHHRADSSAAAEHSLPVENLQARPVDAAVAEQVNGGLLVSIAPVAVLIGDGGVSTGGKTGTLGSVSGKISGSGSV